MRAAGDDPEQEMGGQEPKETEDLCFVPEPEGSMAEEEWRSREEMRLAQSRTSGAIYPACLPRIHQARFHLTDDDMGAIAAKVYRQLGRNVEIFLQRELGEIVAKDLWKAYMEHCIVS